MNLLASSTLKLISFHSRIHCVLQVLDVFTAVALAGILGHLLRRGAVIVATSNRAPWDLNKVLFSSSFLSLSLFIYFNGLF